MGQQTRSPHAPGSTTYWEYALHYVTDILRFDRRELWYVILYGIAVGLLSLAVPLATQTIVNATAFTALPAPVLVLSAIVLGVLVLSSLIRLLQVALDELIQQKVFVRSVLAAVESLRESAHMDKEHDPREIATRFFDIEVFIKNLSYLMTDVLTVVVLSAFAILILSFYNPFLVGFAVFLVISVFIVFRYTLRPGLETNNDVSTTKYRTASWVSHVSRDRTLFHHPQAHNFLLQMTDKIAGEYVQARRAHFQYYFAQNASLFLIQAVSSAALLGLGGWLVIRGELNLGQLVAAEILFSFVIGGVAKLGTYLKYFYDLCTAAKKIAQLTNLPSEPDRGFLADIPWSPSAAIEVNTTRIAAGSVLALKGSTQAEKTKFLRHLWGVRSEPSPGSIGALEVKYAGLPIENIKKKALRNSVLLIDQVSTFDTGFFDNLKIFSSETSQSDLERIYRDCAWLERIAGSNSAHGESLASASRVNRDGVSHQALLSVARTLFSNAPVVLIDSVFSNLSFDDQREFISSFKKLSPHRILIINAEPKAWADLSTGSYDLQTGTLIAQKNGSEIQR